MKTDDLFVWHLYQTSLYQLFLSLSPCPGKHLAGAGTLGIGGTRCHPLTFRTAPIHTVRKPKCVVVFSYTTYDIADCSVRDLKYPSAYVNVNYFIPGIITPLFCSAVFLWSNFYNLPRGHKNIFFPPRDSHFLSGCAILSGVTPPLNIFFFITVAFSAYPKIL